MSIRSSASPAMVFTKSVKTTNNLTGCYTDDFGSYNVVDVVRITSRKNSMPVPISHLIHNLEQDYWGYFVYDKWFPLTPFEVLLGNDTLHWQRIRKADLSYPIVVTDNAFIVDGVHRLCRAFNDGIKTIDTVYISRQELDSIRI